MVTVGIFPFKENSHGKAGNRTQDLMISSQRLRPLDHEAVPVSIITTICFITILIDRYNIPLLPLLRQFLLIPNSINKFMDLRASSTPCLDQFCWDLINTW